MPLEIGFGAPLFICIPRCLFPCWIRCFQYFSNSHQQHLWVETSGTVKIVDSIQSYSKVKTPKRVAGNGPFFPPLSSPPSRRNTCRRRRCRHRGLGRRRRLVAPPTPHLTLAAVEPPPFPLQRHLRRRRRNFDCKRARFNAKQGCDSARQLVGRHARLTDAPMDTRT